jgi:hypothetical protein
MYATDRGTYVVQGAKVTDRAALGDVRNLAADETLVEIDPGLVRHLIKHYQENHQENHGG